MFHFALRKQRAKHEEQLQGQQQEQANLVMDRTPNNRDLITKNRNINTAKTVICISITGFIIVAIGISLTCVGFIIEKSFPNPYNVTGITSIVVGVCILLMSIEIIVKSRREAMEDEDGGASLKKKLKWSHLVPSAKVRPMPREPTTSQEGLSREETRSWVNNAQHGSNWRQEENQQDKVREVVLLPHVLEQDGY